MIRKLLLALYLLISYTVVSGQVSWLHVENGKIVDSTGSDTILKGVQLALGSARGDVPFFDLTDSLQNKFLDDMLKHTVTESDLEDVNSMCANSARLSLITYKDFENDTIPFTYLENNFQQLDSVVYWAKKNQVYLIISMRQTPGGHNSSPHSGNNGLNQLWNNSMELQRVASLWKEIAARYKDEPIIAGFDVLNEPEAPNSSSLNTVYQNIIDSIRSVDLNHIIFLEGNLWGQFTDWINPSLDSNMAFSIHFYLPSDYAVNGNGTYPIPSIGFTKDTLATLLKSRISHSQGVNLPCYIGEFGAMTRAGGYLQYDEDLINIFDSLSQSWNYYDYKNLKGITDAQAFYYTDSNTTFIQMLSFLQAGALFSSFSEQYLDSVLLSLETKNLHLKIDLKNMLSNKMCFPLSVKEPTKNDGFRLKVHPNPANTFVKLTTNVIVVNATIKVYDTFGKLVIQREMRNVNELTLNLDGLSSGVYFVSLTEAPTVRAYGKLTITK